MQRSSIWPAMVVFVIGTSQRGFELEEAFAKKNHYVEPSKPHRMLVLETEQGIVRMFFPVTQEEQQHDEVYLVEPFLTTYPGPSKTRSLIPAPTPTEWQEQYANDLVCSRRRLCDVPQEALSHGLPNRFLLRAIRTNTAAWTSAEQSGSLQDLGSIIYDGDADEHHVPKLVLIDTCATPERANNSGDNKDKRNDANNVIPFPKQVRSS